MSEKQPIPLYVRPEELRRIAESDRIQGQETSAQIAIGYSALYNLALRRPDMQSEWRPQQQHYEAGVSMENNVLSIDTRDVTPVELTKPHDPTEPIYVQRGYN